MSWSTDGGPERLGRRLGRVVVQGRIAARQLADPTTREQLAKAGRRAAERAQPKVQQAADRARQELAARGPDVAERATQQAVDRVFWFLGARSGPLVAVIRPLAQPVRSAAGALARDLASAAGGKQAEDASAPPLPPGTAAGGDASSGSDDPPAPTP